MIETDELAQLIEAAMIAISNNPAADPVASRKQYSIALAAAITLFVVGRKTTVVGTSVTGGAVTGTGTIA